MPSRCLNRVTLIGNLTRDPELKYTPSGMAVISFGLATNRSWTTKDGERKEDAQFHRIVAWNKLAELCSQLLAKGRRIFVGGRIQYREFSDQEGNRRQVTEIFIDDMILLDNKRVGLDQAGRTGGGQPSSAGGGRAGAAAAVDDGTIEDIVIPDEIVETKSEADKESESVSQTVDDAGTKSKGVKKADKKRKIGDSSEEMPF